MPIDTYRIYLDSERFDSKNATENVAQFNTKIPTKKTNYTRYELYVDDFCINLSGMTEYNIIVKALLPQFHSYNSFTKGNNTTIATIFNNNITSDRTTDLCLNYQAPNAPYIINSIPDFITIELTNLDNAAIDLTDVRNVWILNLRIDAHYDYYID